MQFTTIMAKPSKSSSPGRRQPPPRALRQFQAALGLEGEAWRTFLVHAQKGFTDYERATWTGPSSPLRIEEVPETWFQEPEAVGYVTLRVLAEGKAELATRNIRHFLDLEVPVIDPFAA